MRSWVKILVIDDESSITGALQVILEEQGYVVQTAASMLEASRLLQGRAFDLVFTDLRLPDTNGLEVLNHIKAENPDTEVILMTAHGSLDIAISAIKRGAYYYVEKPFTPDEIVMLTERALQFAGIKQENRVLKSTLGGEKEAYGMIGSSQQMRQIYETIRATAPSEASVLIEGESGTGKELIATAVHLQSKRASRPFIRINCAAFPPDLIESELFGYKRGAFTGADRDKRGLIEAAATGTLLLDEIAEMPIHLQAKLLRVLQERKIRRLGDEQEIQVDFRLVSSTNRDTRQAAREGLFREDLYFRISTVKITVPPLRERPEDVLPLADHFLHRYVEKYQKQIRNISQPALSLLTRYDWPGNIRELESVIERAVLFCQGDQLTVESLPEHLSPAASGQVKCLIPPHLTLEEIEREAIAQTLERTGGNIKKTAQLLDVHRPTLYRKLKRFKLINIDSGADSLIDSGADSIQGHTDAS
ncbi:MAG: sigma-54 dependent transcriptional regulator [Acidobacteria bacterium]|nr:sigma-54 dependent transcriptional regulator [Acidobacteriota bacterium]